MNKIQDQIKDVLLQIVEVGILRIRMFGFAGRAEECGIEADHIHNLPSVLLSLQEDLLRYYIDVERPSYLRAVRSDVEAFKASWDKLDRLVAPSA